MFVEMSDPFPISHYSAARIHKTLRVKPAMAAGISEIVWKWSDIVEMMDKPEEPKSRAPYKKAVS